MGGKRHTLRSLVGFAHCFPLTLLEQFALWSSKTSQSSKFSANPKVAAELGFLNPFWMVQQSEMCVNIQFGGESSASVQELISLKLFPEIFV